MVPHHYTKPLSWAREGLDLDRRPGDSTGRGCAPITAITTRSDPMSRRSYAIAAAVLATACLGVAAYAQQPAPPPFATTKVDGTDNVYVFRYGGHQSMFVVTSAGVIATDPIGYGRPQAVVTYVDEIKKVSNQPIKYLIYSHQ